MYRKKPKSKLFQNYTLVYFFLLGIIILIGIISAMVFQITMKPEYTKNVHGHMVNAYYSNTPELMIENLEKAKQGMINLGLTENLYMSHYSWEQTPDNKMDYQYKHIDSIIERAYDVIEWREDASHESGTQANDIYEQKMKNLRNFLKSEGWSDDIAYETWLAHNHSFIWFISSSFGIAIIIGTYLLLGIPIGIRLVTLALSEW